MPQKDNSQADFMSWFDGHWREVEKWVDTAVQSAVGRVRSMLVDEIRSLSKRVEQMHELLDQLEQLVESQNESSELGPDDDESEEPSSSSTEPTSP